MSAADTAIGLAGFAVLLARGPQSGWARAALGAGALLLAAGVAGFLVLQRRGRLAAFFGEHGLVRRLAGAQLGERLASASRDVDGRLAELHAERPGDFRTALVLHLAGHVRRCPPARDLPVLAPRPLRPRDPRVRVRGGGGTRSLLLLRPGAPRRPGGLAHARHVASGASTPPAGCSSPWCCALEQVLWAAVGFLAVPFLLRARRGRRRLRRRPGRGTYARRQPRSRAADGRRTGMLSRSGFFRRILASPAAREFLLNSLAVGEADSALDLDRVAEHVPDPVLAAQDLSPLRRGAEARAAVPPASRGAGLSLHAAPRRSSTTSATSSATAWARPGRASTIRRPSTTHDLILFFCGSKAGEERACAGDGGADPRPRRRPGDGEAAAHHPRRRDAPRLLRDRGAPAARRRAASGPSCCARCAPRAAPRRAPTAP